MSTTTVPKAPAERAQPVRGALSEWVVTILILLFGTTTILQAFVVPSGSMEHNILIGDHLLADKLSYAPAGSISSHFLPYTPVKRGDIIVFRWPGDIRQNYVKRVIGVPGDHIRIFHKQLYLDGRKVDEPYVEHTSPYFDPYRDDFPNVPNTPLPERAQRMLADNVVKGEIVVPPGNYFAMGDNRDNSSDSRYWGFVPRENIIAKPLIIFWSFDAPTAELSNQNPLSPAHLVDLAEHFFTRTRWSRTFKLIRGYPLK